MLFDVVVPVCVNDMPGCLNLIPVCANVWGLDFGGGSEFEGSFD